MCLHEPTLLLTRPKAQSKAFLNACEKLAGRELSAVISPLITIEPTASAPNLDRFSTIVFTSGNGVESVQRTATLTGRTVVTVGEATAMLANTAGAEARALGEDVDAFVRNARQLKGPILFCRGEYSRGDLADRLREQNHIVEEAIVYNQLAIPLNDEARRLLAGTKPVVAPLFSPRTARLLAEHGPFAAPMTIIAMSLAVAAAWETKGKVHVSEAPDARRMAELAASLLVQ